MALYIFERDQTPVPTERGESPEFTASAFSCLTFSWMTPIMTTGYQRKLELNDIWLINPNRSVEPLSRRFQMLFRHPFALHDTFKRDCGMCLLIASIAQVIVPFTLRFLLNFFSEAWDAATSERPSPHPGPPIGVGLGLSVCTNQFVYRGFMVGAQSRAVLVAEIGSSARSGSLMTLMSSDTTRIDQAAGLFHIVWASPITILLTFALLLTNLSYLAIPGFGVLFFGAGGLTLALRTLVERCKTINKTTKARVSLAQEIIRSIQRLRNIRKDEVQMIVKLQLVRNAIQSTSIILPILGAMSSFITCAATSDNFTSARIFSSLVLFNALNVSFNLLPVAIGQLADAWSAVRRLEQLLLASDHREEIDRDMTSGYGIEADGAGFTWANRLTDASVSESLGAGGTPRSSITLPTGAFALRDMSFNIKKGELLVVIGSVGSGKSPPPPALAGEMRKTGGNITQGVASRAYCPQDPWIKNATVKDNITFGHPFDPTFYNKVIDACCLLPDLQALRGINLSGGQRQRVNLARAIYSNSDIVLMDDPLSAHGICGILKKKTRILSTHQLHVLSRCDRVLWLENGTIKDIRTFQELQRKNPEFQDMMSNYAQKESQQGNRRGDESEKHFKHTVGHSGETRPDQSLGDGALVKEEEFAIGKISLKLFNSYLKSAGNPLFGLGSNALTSIWLSWWVSFRFDISRSLIQAVLFYIYGVTISIINGRASRKMVHQATASIIMAPLSFHDLQPLGRIMNRLSRDAEVMDNQLPEALRIIIVLLSYCIHSFLIALVPLTAGVLYAASYYKASAGQFKRHESILRSILFARFGETASGVQTIRAYGAEAHIVAAAVVLAVGIGMMQLVIRSLAEVENSMVSTERLHEYETALPQEPSQTSHMVDVVLQYRSDLPPTLQGLNLRIQGGEKIGIVGHTGAGKTFLTTALFRLVELSHGKIVIDGLDIASIPLQESRDPFQQHTDLELWTALHSAGMKKFSTNTSDEGVIHLDGRQLLTIARALLRDCRIVVCDEATSSVDQEADRKIQKTIMEAFASKTVLTIAHRLDTVVGYDKVCVLEQGRVVEFDRPFNLWERGGAFRALCDRSCIKKQDFGQRSWGQI
ncbi:P-loop containing nucleoside triphosphate hydrolase protein [Xylaria digitata]|nr:P-loop containing nucleoside triphosphate hydrolase protein [Xylaria digitata]